MTSPLQTQPNPTAPSEGRSAQPEAHSPQSTAQGDGNLVLVVDDDQGVLTMAHAILQAAGYRAVGAISGEHAFDIYRQAMANGTGFEVVLLDLTLPGGMSGMETLDALRNYDPTVRVIATSGYFDDTDASATAQAAKRRGFVGVLPKPYSAERLLRLVHWGMGKAA